MKPVLFALSLFAGLALGAAASAVEVKERLQNGALSFSGGQSFSNAVLFITGPDDYEREETAARGLPVFRAQNSGKLVDGLYQYSLSAATDEKVKIKKEIDNGRGDLARDYTLKPFSMSGNFMVKKGTIIAVDAANTGADVDPEENEADGEETTAN